MEESNYTVIPDWMVEKLHLSGNELMIYAIIHGFSQDGKSVFWGSGEYLSKKSGASHRAVTDILKKLVEKKLIVKKITKSYYYNLPDGTQQEKRAQGGANHFCMYYTAISRDKSIMKNKTIDNNEVKPMAEIANEKSEIIEENAYKNAFPIAKSACFNSMMVENANNLPIAFSANVPMAKSACFNSPMAENSNAPMADSANVPMAKIANNIKHNSKEETTTTTVNQSYIWNDKTLDSISTEIFGGSGLFTHKFKNDLISFLNSNNLNFEVGKEYIKWSFEQAKNKAKTDKIGYFVSTVLKDTFYSQFSYTAKSEKENKIENTIHCPVCNNVLSKGFYYCPKCHTSTEDFENASAINIAKQIYALPKDQKENIESELKEVRSLLLKSSFPRPGDIIRTPEEIKLKEDEIYKKYGILKDEDKVKYKIEC